MAAFRTRVASTRAGFTLAELTVALSVAAVLTAVMVGGYREWAGSAALDRAARVARGELARARLLAVARRQTIRVRLSAGGDLVLVDAADRILGLAPLGRGGPFGLDSVRVRPATLRFNSRGQAAPGSVYLYRGRRAVRLVCNFIGRVRRERFSLPPG